MNYFSILSKPICLPGGEEPPEGTKCFIAGWGGTEDTNTRPTNLLETSVIISDLNECQDAYEILPTQSKEILKDNSY